MMIRNTSPDIPLPGIWESAIMILEFYPVDDQNIGSGRISSPENERKLDFQYRLVLGLDKPTLVINTPMTGEMNYWIAGWSPDSLTLVKEGSSTETIFRRRSTQ